MKSDDPLMVARLVAQLSIALKWQIIGREKGCRKPGLMAHPESGKTGLDHSVGHSLLLLYDAKALNCQKSNEFKGLDRCSSNTALSLFFNKTEISICITI